MCRNLVILSVCIVLVALTSLAAVAEESEAVQWTRWRGPNLDGAIRGVGVFGTDQVGLKMAWSRQLGSGYSGITIYDGRLVTMFTDGEFDYAVALDSSSGDEIWRYKIDTMYAGHDGSNDGPIGTPAIDGDSVYGLGPKGQLFAVRLKDGSEIWSVKIDEQLEAKAATYGFTTTPLVVGDVLFVQTGGPEDRAHSGFDKQTGKVLWSTGEDVVAYQSPVTASLGGVSQIVAVGNNKVMGLDPASGRVLWSHTYNTEEGEGSANPVVVEGGRLLINAPNEAVLLQVERGDSGFEVKELWRSQVFKNSFASPVFHEGHFYGFDGNFLACVDAESGEKVWKSRPPGGNGLILVDGHLAIFEPKGGFVLVKASADGYDEVARVQVSETGSFTWPSFAEGDFFVRNLEDIARIAITDSAAPTAVAEARPAAHRFAAFVREVEASDNKRALVDDFMNAQERLPIIEGEFVHFVYRGASEDVGVTGSMTEFFVEEGMERIEGTDLWHKTYEIEPGARWEYQFNIDFENVGPDPANPRRVPGMMGGDFSELLTATYTPPEHVKAYRGDTPGTLETFNHKSDILENEREVVVYLPAGYASGSRSYPLLVVTEGDEWLAGGNLPNSLNNLIGDSVAPLVVAFVKSVPDPQAAQAEHNGPKAADYARMLTDEIVPYLDENYRLASGTESRGIMGYGGGVQTAVRAALARPDLFGKVAVQSAYLPGETAQEMLSMAGESRSNDIRILVYWNHYELKNAQYDFDLAADSQRLNEALKRGGYEVGGGEVLDAAGWGSWRARAGEILEAFFPVE
jgi:enterochelin esterase-like enzyme/outer membrane protein assembly factor BamB